MNKGVTAMAQAINTRVCIRCGGTGEHSFNLKDGTVCYGCGGTGKQIIAPKGQKKMKPTAELRNCKVGDIIDMNKVICEVTSIRWIKDTRGNYNQVVRYTRLVNGETMKTWRSFTYHVTENCNTLVRDGSFNTNYAIANELPMIKAFLAQYPKAQVSYGWYGQQGSATAQYTPIIGDDMHGKEVE
jgi:ribosomal protein L37E